MKNTEDLLTGALDAAAETVRPERVRPLTQPRRGIPASRRQWSARFAPVAAAVAVVLVVAIALVVSSGSHPGHAAGGAAATGTSARAQAAATPPTYYAEVEGKIYTARGNQVVVRSTATGAVVARVTNPVIAGRPNLSALSVTVAPGDRTFYAVYSEDSYMGTGDLVVYQFHLTASGTVTGLAEINGGLITGQNILFNLGAFTVSPDGSQLALAVAATSADAVPSAVAEEILVINLPTGAHTVWRGGMDRAGQVLFIMNVSWTGNGKSLVYLAQWCPSDAVGEGMAGVACQLTPSAAQVRELEAAGGGTLNTGQVLLQQSARYPLLAQALIDPDGTALEALVQDSHGLQVVTISVATGRITSVPDPSVSGSPLVNEIHLAADSTGKYLLLSQGANGTEHGRIRAGTLRELAPFIPVSDLTNGWMQLAW